MVRATREAKGMTQRALALAAGTSNGFISVLENSEGESHSLDLLKRIAAALGVPLSKLIDPPKAGRAKGRRAG